MDQNTEGFLYRHFSRIVFVKGFYTVMTEQGRNRRADHGFTQQCFQVVNERELGPAFYKELQHARILTGRTVKLLASSMFFS